MADKVMKQLFIETGDHAVELQTGERLTAVVVATQDASLTVDLKGPHAEVDIYALWMTSERVELDISVNHLAPDCRSFQMVKGLAAGAGTGVFRGSVHVAPAAQRTSALQQSRNILLSPTARAHVEPQLEIYADDVKCSHGATVGQLDSEAIYYMRQRGLSEAAARRLLLQGFATDIVAHLSDPALREKILKQIEERI